MGKFNQICALLVTLFGVFSYCQGAGVLDVLDQPALLESRFSDPVFVRRVAACVLEQAACDVFGNLIKNATYEILTNRCARCTPQQAVNAERVEAAFARRYPREWQAIVAKYQYARG